MFTFNNTRGPRRDTTGRNGGECVQKPLEGVPMKVALPRAGLVSRLARMP